MGMFWLLGRRLLRILGFILIRFVVIIVVIIIIIVIVIIVIVIVNERGGELNYGDVLAVRKAIAKNSWIYSHQVCCYYYCY